jgi:hypothetical protein
MLPLEKGKQDGGDREIVAVFYQASSFDFFGSWLRRNAI